MAPTGLVNGMLGPRLYFLQALGTQILRAWGSRLSHSLDGGAVIDAMLPAAIITRHEFLLGLSSRHHGF